MEPKAVFLGRALPERYSQLTFVRPFGMAVGRGIEGFEVTAGDALGSMSVKGSCDLMLSFFFGA